MPRITRSNDAYGHELWAFLTEGRADEIVERDDGFITASDWPKRYFAEFKAWPHHERQAMRSVQGSRALDVGCGAGRVSLYLQRRGLNVTAIDNSPLAVRLCRKRGVRDARVLPIEQIRRFPAGAFDTVAMFGNNFGLFGSFERARRLLRQLHRITSSGAVILAESLSPYGSGVAAHARYQHRNRQRGRMGGQIRIRVRFRQIKGPWFDYLLVSPTEMKRILVGTGWQLEALLPSRSGPIYVAIIRRLSSSTPADSATLPSQPRHPDPITRA
jgi:SAM-dependent methyltransferase